MRVAVVASAQIFGGFQNLPPPQSLDFSAFFGLSHLFPPRLSISVIFDTDLVTLHSSCAQYDTVFVGFPIWWYEAPHIIETFLESCDLSGKTVVPFATSGGSSMGKTAKILAPSCPGATVLDGKVLRASSSEADLKAWVSGLHLA